MDFKRAMQNLVKFSPYCSMDFKIENLKSGIEFQFLT